MASDAPGPPLPPSSGKGWRAVSAHPARQATLAFERAPVGLATVDGDGRLQAVNPRFCELVGLTADALRGRLASELLPVGEALVSAAKEGLPASWYQLSLDVEQGAAGDLLLAVGRGDDATMRLLTLVRRDELPGTPEQDALTGSTSQGLFQDRLRHAMERADRLDQGLALLLVQLDPFRSPAKGAVETELVRQVARRIRQTFRQEDTVAWFGKARWGVLIEHPVTPESLQTAALRFQEAMDAPFHLAGRMQLLTTSIGIARYPDDAEDDIALMEQSEAALRRAIRSGPGHHEFFEPRLRRRLEERAVFLSQLQEALLSPGQHFHLVYQPQVDLASGRCLGLEALVRWQHPRLGLLYPRDILPMASELDQVIRLDRWVVERVILQHRQWHEAGSPLAGLGLSVNLDPSMLEQSVFDGRPLDHYLRQQATALDWLSLEIKASGLELMGEVHVHLLKRLRQLGVSLVADDIGTDPVSLPRLASLPLSRAKLSRELVSALGRRALSERVLAAMTAGLKALGLEAVAVGVETEAQRASVGALDIALAQGNVISPPLGTGELAAWLESRGK
ncbi:EAL domain-containing protein [Halomonas campaniensis]|uniref:EAL domain-containing protein n=1 Tax=Halomonas campaniensis TaxID=213554 RepID=UPI003970BFB4